MKRPFATVGERSRAPMCLINLRFCDRDLEREFRRSWLRLGRRLDFVWTLSALFYFSLYTVVTFSLIPEAALGGTDIRLAVGLPAALLPFTAMILLPADHDAQVPAHFAGIALVFAVVAYQMRVTDAPYSLFFLLELAAILIYGQSNGRLLFVYTLLFTLIAGTVTLVATLGFGGSEIAGILSPTGLVLTLSALMVIGVFAAYSREVFARGNFVIRRDLKAENLRAELLAEEAIAASTSKSRFLAIVSHELRTPLNAILGYAEMLRLGMTGEALSPTTRTYVENIHESGAHLHRLIEQVLEVTRAGYGAMMLEEERIDVTSLIQGVADEFAARVRTGKLNLSLDVEPGLPALHGDPRLLGQALFHLFGNACKFTRSHGDIACRARLADGGIEISIRDTGIGMSREEIDAAFGTFGQSDDGLDRRNEGLGLGLPLVRALVELHQGEIAVESEPGSGTEVVLRFPAERSRFAADPEWSTA